jgi:hypothetical protein
MFFMAADAAPPLPADHRESEQQHQRCRLCKMLIARASQKKQTRHFLISVRMPTSDPTLN